MTASELMEVESKLALRLPPHYREYMLSEARPKIPGVFKDVNQIISVNELNRQMSWLGRPLDPVFYIFGIDAQGRVLLMDLDIPGPVIMAADYNRKCSKVTARSFQDWVLQYHHSA